VFGRLGAHRDRSVRGRACGYPTEHGQEYCLFHRDDESYANNLRAEIEQAAAEGACLREAKLSGADLGGANLSGAEPRWASHSGANPWFADLSGAELHFANLSGARLDGADLSGAKLNGANLSGAKLNDANLSDAELNGANLSGAELEEANLSGAELFVANLSDAELRLADLLGTTLRFANLSNARLCNAKISPDTDLDRVMWWAEDKRASWPKWLQIREPVLREEGEARDEDALANCERLYRQIKRCYQESGQYDTAGIFFVREMECKRKQLPRWSLMRAVYHVLHFVSDYFENPWRVVVVGLLVILLFAFVHAGIGFFWAVGKGCPQGGQAIGGGITLSPFAADWAAMGRALYFSAITFTATGYGDYVPNPGCGHFFAGLESLIGVFLMAMFLVCLARKFGRA